ncbi:MAG: hypothetical protein O3C23_02925 [bacterium]|nr:hypothetical protein [bacterium]
MQKNIYIIVIGAIVVAVLGGFLFFKSVDAPGETAPGVSSLPPVEENGESITVTYTDSGYVPKEVTILQGTKVIFKNESSRFMWPATAIHPTHTIYPGSDILKCGTSIETQIFDACQPIGEGENWSFVFGEVGSWRYHDHLQVVHSGKITVE